MKYAKVTEEDLFGLYPEAELILLEGFKWTAYPKLEIVRRGVSDAPVCDPKTLLGLITDADVHVDGVPSFGLDNIEGIAELIEREVRK